MNDNILNQQAPAPAPPEPLEKLVNGNPVPLTNAEETEIRQVWADAATARENGDDAIDQTLTRFQFMGMMLSTLSRSDQRADDANTGLQGRIIAAINASTAGDGRKRAAIAKLLWEDNFVFRDKRTQLMIKSFADLQGDNDRQRKRAARRLWKSGTEITIVDVDEDA